MRAWIKADGRLELRDAPQPAAKAGEWLVRVEAVSLNRGEVRAAALAADGVMPGWDVAGTIAEGPDAGRRVAGMLGSGAWAEYAAVPVHAAAFIPEGVATTVAATLPLVGLTVMRALAVGGPLLGKRVLITGATGGVGSLAVQLATMSGARVSGVAAVDDAVSGEYDLILESAGGTSLERSIEAIARGGVVVTIGNSSERPASFNPRSLYRKGGASIYGLLVFEEVESRRVGSRELACLLDLVRAGTLTPAIEVERSWLELDRTLDDLSERRFRGKAVLRVE
jgi:NADPH2:quinone reductase